MEHGKGSFSIFRTGHPGLFVYGRAESRHEVINLSADDRWKVCIDNGFSIVPESDLFAPLQVLERRQAQPELTHWMGEEYDDTKWESAVFDTTLSAEFSPGNLNKRPIPFLYRKEKRFLDSRIVSGEIDRDEFNKLLWEKQSIFPYIRKQGPG